MTKAGGKNGEKEEDAGYGKKEGWSTAKRANGEKSFMVD